MTHRIALFGGALVAAVIGIVDITATQQAGSQTQVATPRTANDKPDLSGVWIGFGGGGGEGGRDYTPDAQGNITSLSPFRPCHPGQECRAAVNSERDSGMRQRIMAPSYNVPLYKPEYWDRVQYLDMNGNKMDLSNRCYPLGLPRMGAPDKIMQSGNEVAFFYRRNNRFRVIPTDGRPHDPVRAMDVQWDGEPSGRWDGDTLIIESVGFTDESWLGWPGYLHSHEMRVVERVRREGNTLTWQATVHDPEVLMKPYEMNPVRRRLSPDPGARLTEDPPCEESDLEHMYTRERG